MSKSLMDSLEKRWLDFLDGVQEFFESGKFAIFAISLLFFTALLLGAGLFIPKSFGKLGKIAEEFKVWCFGYDPTTGTYDWGYFSSFFGVPLMLGGILWFLWGDQVKALWKRKKATFGKLIGLSLVITLTSALALTSFYDPLAAKASSAIFSAEKSRTSYHPPEFTLTDHRGNRISLTDLKDKIVMVTGVYSSCSTACPMIMAQAKEAVEALTPEERSYLRVLAITLDPDRDDVERLGEMAKAHSLPYPLYRLLTGPKEKIFDILDRFGFIRYRNKDGIIQHNNLFLLIDKNQKIAYRFYLGKQQLQWLIRSLKLLIAEKIEESGKERNVKE